jgi:translation elongation factor EF-Tu-like GTPase
MLTTCRRLLAHSVTMMKPDLPAASVMVRFLSAAEGGRPSPVNSGYRAQVVFHDAAGAAVEHDCVFDFRESERAIERDGEKWLPLDVEDAARMAPFDAERMSAYIVAGAGFEIREGSTLVGSGRVLEPVALS